MENSYQYPGEELGLFEEARNWKRYFASHIRPYITGDVLEVGAGIGETTGYLVNERCSSWTCLEPDAKLFSVIEKKIASGELPAICSAVKASVMELQPSRKFNTIIYIDVLEHIEEDKNELAMATAHLHAGGCLIVLSPAFNWLMSPFDRAVGHYRRYTASTLRMVVPDSLEEKKIFYLESMGIPLLMINKLFSRKSYPTRSVVKAWDRMLIPVSRLVDRLVFHRIGKTIIGIWQKK